MQPKLKVIYWHYKHYSREYNGDLKKNQTFALHLCTLNADQWIRTYNKIYLWGPYIILVVSLYNQIMTDKVA